VSGTILSFERGLLWPNFMATFGDVFGVAFGIEGFDVVHGQVANVDPLAALFNTHLWHEFVHMYVAGYLVGGSIIAAVYARSWLRGMAVMGRLSGRSETS
jgi:cytochrome d ubiquinol oxidase subunit I